MSDPNPLLDTTRMLGEARRILDGIEATTLGGVAQMLAETAESLARTARELKVISPDEWLTFEEAAYLKKSPKAFEKVVARRDPEALPDRTGDTLLPQGARRLADRALVILADDRVLRCFRGN